MQEKDIIKVLEQWSKDNANKSHKWKTLLGMAIKRIVQNDEHWKDNSRGTFPKLLEKARERHKGKPDSEQLALKEAKLLFKDRMRQAKQDRGKEIPATVVNDSKQALVHFLKAKNYTPRSLDPFEDF